jgi:hypothetical protein
MALTQIQVADQLTEEHNHIKKGLVDIQEAVKKPVSEKELHDWRLEFIWQLREFRNHLLKHFDFEEDGGFMHEIVEKAPEKLNVVKALGNQHQEIALALDHIIEHLKSLDHFDMKMYEEIRQHISEMVDTILKHKTAEIDLMQMVYYQDYGYPS